MPPMPGPGLPAPTRSTEHTVRGGPPGADDSDHPAFGTGGTADQTPLLTLDRPRRSRAWVVVLVGFLVVGLGSASFVLGRVNTLLSSIKRDPSMLPASSQPTSDEAGSPVDFVVMGADGPNDKGNSDVLMVAHLTASRDKLYLVSFPKDLYVGIPGHGEGRISSASDLGGPQLTIATLQNLLGIDVEHAAMVDFDGFLGLCGVVGGVNIHNRLASSAEGYDFPAGNLHLTGAELLAYVRQRDGLPRGDLDRAERERLVLKALLLKVAAPDVLANPVTFAKLTGQLGQYVTVDHRLTDAATWQLASSLRIAGADDIRPFQAPIRGAAKAPDGSAVELVDPSAIKQLGAALRTDAMGQYVTQYAMVDE